MLLRLSTATAGHFVAHRKQVSPRIQTHTNSTPAHKKVMKNNMARHLERSRLFMPFSPVRGHTPSYYEWPRNRALFLPGTYRVTRIVDIARPIGTYEGKFSKQHPNGVNSRYRHGSERQNSNGSARGGFFGFRQRYATAHSLFYKRRYTELGGVGAGRKR